MLLQTQELMGNAVGLGRHLLATGSPHMYKDVFEELARVQPSDVNEIAYKYLKRDRAVSLYIEPETDHHPHLALRDLFDLLRRRCVLVLVLSRRKKERHVGVDPHLADLGE